MSFTPISHTRAENLTPITHVVLVAYRYEGYFGSNFSVDLPIRKTVCIQEGFTVQDKLDWHIDMVAVQHIIAPATLPVADLSIFSYNVLLPNSIDGWWTYKMYLPPLQQQQGNEKSIADWEHRKTLIQDRISMVGTSKPLPGKVEVR
jgi:hypothetical protein